MTAGAARLGLGTVQFGLDYGITNSTGRVAESEAAAIVRVAAAAGLDTIDTAALYGRSEEVLGRTLPPGRFRLVTKTPKFGDIQTGAEAAALLRATFEQSLRRLQAGSVHGLLIHDAADLAGPLGPALWAAMETLRQEGRVARIGVSVYDGREIDLALDRFPVTIVQLPWNPLDLRLDQDGQLRRLAAAGVEIHARSLFLQGLLLQPPRDIPARFGPLADAVAELAHAAAGASLSQLEGVLALAWQRTEIDRFIVGATTAGELQAIVLAAEKAQGLEEPIRFTTSRALDPLLLNPARWAELEAAGQDRGQAKDRK